MHETALIHVNWLAPLYSFDRCLVLKYSPQLHVNQEYPDAPLLEHVQELITKLEAQGIQVSPEGDEEGEDEGEGKIATSTEFNIHVIFTLGQVDSTWGLRIDSELVASAELSGRRI